MMPKLIIRGIAHELADDIITIGRSPENTIVIDDPTVSARHAEMRLAGENYSLKDVGSTNGTRVNGISIIETILRFDDRISFGGIDARYERDTPGSRSLPRLQSINLEPAESSVMPADFANLSPFPRRKEGKDRVRTAAIIAVAVALLAFLGSMLAVLTMMRAPTL